MKKGLRGKYKSETPKFPIQCLFCGKSYIGMRKNRQFCSKLCINRFNNQKKPKKPRIILSELFNRVCESCNKTFVFKSYPSHTNSGHKGNFCSKKCFITFSKLNSFNFPCKICGNAIFTQPAQLKYRTRSTCSKICRTKLAKIKVEKRRIELGYTKHQIDRLARYSTEAKKWRKEVFVRDDYTCQLCGIRGTYLEADHIKPWAFFPELRFDLSNGRTLCRFCHNTTKIGYKAMRKLYEKK